MKQCILILLCVMAPVYANVLLQKPDALTEAEVERLAQDWQTQFTWRFAVKSSFTCYYKNKKASFLLRLCGLPFCSYNYSYSDQQPSCEVPQRDYYFAQPLKIESSHSSHISVEELYSLLQHKKFIFYTGAGISASAAVATMNDLEASLKINESTRKFITEAFFNADVLAAAFAHFCESAIYGSPTPAHYAVRDIAVYNNVCIITDNVDLIQQRTGVRPLFSHSDALYNAQPEDFKNVDALVCIGLSCDDCGLIALYKKCNPQGFIVAVDVGMPNYLSDDDYIVRQDAQEVMPELARLLGVKKGEEVC